MTSRPDAAETAGVNDRVQLAAAGRVLNGRLLERRHARGRHGRSTRRRRGCRRRRRARAGRHAAARRAAWRDAPRVAPGAVVGPDCTLTDTEIGEDAGVRATTADRAVIGPRCDVGPYTYLRPGTRLGVRRKAGAYVEMKAANDRRRREGSAPDLRRRRRGRRGQQHRLRDGVRQLRRGRPSTVPSWASARVRRQRHACSSRR